MTIQTCPPPREDASGPVRRGAGIVSVSLAALFLAACGGDYDAPVPVPPPPPPPAAVTQVPASAADSDASLEAFAISQPLSETAEPLTLELVPTFPSSETEEPIAITG